MKMHKGFVVSILLVFVILALLIVFITSENTLNTNDIAARKICNFKTLYRNVKLGNYLNWTDILVDEHTRIIYIYDINKGGLSPLYESDGSLKKWKGNLE